MFLDLPTSTNAPASLGAASTMLPTTSILRALSFAPFILSIGIATAQSCTNYGTSSASGCLCPPGFGGANCSQPACGGTIFDGSHRSLTPSSAASGGFPNLTSSGCSCSNGWTGLGCNVCTTASACQSAYAAVSGNASSAAAAQVSGLNDTMVCNTSPMVWAAGELSCQVDVCSPLYLIDNLTHLILESDITSDLPIAIHTQHPSNPQRLALPIAKCFWHGPVPQRVSSGICSALLQRRRTIFLHCFVLHSNIHKHNGYLDLLYVTLRMYLEHDVLRSCCRVRLDKHYQFTVGSCNDRLR